MSIERNEDPKTHNFDPVKAEELALSHAWGWFTVHAAQRMQSINLFLISFTVIVAGYGASFQAKNYLVSLIVAIAGIVITLAFWFLEERNRTLVKVAEVPLAFLQQRLAQQVGLPSLEIIAQADLGHEGWRKYAKYSWVIRALMVAGIVWMLVGLIAALVAAQA